MTLTMTKAGAMAAARIFSLFASALAFAAAVVIAAIVATAFALVTAVAKIELKPSSARSYY